MTNETAQPQSRSKTPYVVGGVVALLAVGGCTTALYVRRVHRLYPVHPPQPYHLTPVAQQLNLKLPTTLDAPGYLSATVPLPRTGDPLGTFTKAFYAHPYFCVEGWVMRRLGYAGMPRPPGVGVTEVAPDTQTQASRESHVGGLFDVVAKTPQSVLLYWTTPAKWLKGRLNAVAGGTQELSAVPKPGPEGLLEVSYGTAHFTLGGTIKPRSLDALDVDRAILFHAAVKRMRKWAKVQNKL